MKLKLSIIFFVLLITSTRAQVNLYSYYEGIYDDNIFNNYDNVSDFINSLAFGTGYNFESEINNLQLYYEGNLSFYQTNTSKSFDMHKIGLVETHLFSADSINDNPFNAGINFSFRNNRDEYEVYDFQQYSLYFNYRHLAGGNNFILPGYVFNRNIYKNYSLFSHNEHKFFLKWISNFETGTSLIFNAEYNYKKYLEEYNIDGYLNEASLLKFSANIGQSLGDKTGVNFYAAYRNNLSDGSRYLFNDSLLYYEEEIFNDIYAYDGIETGLGFKHYFNQTIELTLEAKYLIRNYSSLPAADKSGTELNYLREDIQFGLGAGIAFDLSNVINGASISANWNYIKNSSNDYYYKYSNQVISISFDYGF